MKNILTKILIPVVIFFSLTLSANALKLEENNNYSGTIKDSHRNNIPLPPGEWLLTEINIVKPKGRGLSTFVEYTFYNSDVGYVFYFGPKGTKGSGDMWIGRKTPSMCDGNPVAGKTKIRGINNTEWCVFEDGEYIEFRNYTAQNYSQYYHSYYIDKTLLRDKSKATLQSIGARIFDEVRKNKAGDIGFLSSRLDLNKSSSFTSNYSSQTESKYQTLSNKEICIKATKLDGSGWMPSHSNDYVKEAWSRDLDIIQCRDLTGRKIAKKDTSNLKDRLMELKSLFDAGLITQDQYDKKSSEILEEF